MTSVTFAGDSAAAMKVAGSVE
jgi:hypothetical protein